ncbi:MAG TPA: type II secretion system F family protein, partial [Candidatus Baltobacteraceae bacterium]|nr:type II secretion system F family protein [Candidatus Baltobacteraceae bacterium]
QQLAAMLRDGIPLEGALKRLCEEMRRGQLRAELQTLEADLAKGTPLADAIAPRQLPELYKRMIIVGVKGGNLPDALTMLADYFQRRNNLWARMKGLMVYPSIVLFIAFVLSCFLSYILGHFIWNNLTELSGFYGNRAVVPVSVGLWMPPVLFGIALILVFAGLIILPARQMLRWRLPAFKEASLSEVASIIWLLLKNGMPLNEALQLVEQLEAGTLVEKEIAQWRQRLASGQGKFSEMAATAVIFPPLFIWTVAQAGEDLASGFKRTAELYQERALYRTEMFLYSVLPCSILLIATLIISQIQPVFRALTMFIQALSGNGGGD